MQQLILDYRPWYQIEAQTQLFYSMCLYANFRFCIFMSMTKKLKIKEKIEEKNNRVYLYTLPICHLLVITDYQTGYQMEA